MEIDNLKRIHLVGKGEQAGSDVHSNIRLTLENFFADILCDKRSSPEIWHWIVQRDGSPEIIQWGHEDTQEKAEEEARAFLQNLARIKPYKEQRQSS